MFENRKLRKEFKPNYYKTGYCRNCGTEDRDNVKLKIYHHNSDDATFAMFCMNCGSLVSIEAYQDFRRSQESVEWAKDYYDDKDY